MRQPLVSLNISAIPMVKRHAIEYLPQGPNPFTVANNKYNTMVGTLHTMNRTQTKTAVLTTLEFLSLSLDFGSGAEVLPSLEVAEMLLVQLSRNLEAFLRLFKRMKTHVIQIVKLP